MFIYDLKYVLSQRFKPNSSLSKSRISINTSIIKRFSKRGSFHLKVDTAKLLNYLQEIKKAPLLLLLLLYDFFI